MSSQKDTSSQSSEPLVVETNLFSFEAPTGYKVESLDEQAELEGPNGEFLVVSSYSLEAGSDEAAKLEFVQNITSAMIQAASEPDLKMMGSLKKEVREDTVPVWRLLSQTRDGQYFFDQYAIIEGHHAVVVTLEGESSSQNSSSALVEDSVHAIEFKV